MKVSTLIIFLTILFKYTQLYMGSTINIVSISILGIIVVDIILCLKYKKIKNTKTFIIMLLLSIIVMIIAKDPNFILPLLIVVILQDEDLNVIVKKFFICSVIMFLLTIILSELGIINSIDWYKRDEENHLILRNTLGFGNPNTVFLFIFGILINYYLIKGRLSLKEKVVWLVIVIFFYQLTLCRTGFIVSVLFILFSNFFNKINENKVVKWIFNNAFLLLTILSFIIAFQFGKSNNIIESLLSHRPIYWYLNIQGGISLIGNNVQVVLDNYMLNILCKQGILVYIIYMVMFYKAIKKFNQNQSDYKYTVVIIFTLIYGISEAAISVSNNISILLIFIIYFNNKFFVKNGDRNEKNIICDK